MTGKTWRTVLLPACIVLVLAILIAPAAADTMVRQENTDHDGNDYTSLFPGASGYNGTPGSCMENCLNQASCNAATFASRDNSCWLKENVPPATERSGMTSFVRQKEGAAGPVTVVTTRTAVALPSSPPPATETKKSPGFGFAIAILGGIGGLALIRRSVG